MVVVTDLQQSGWESNDDGGLPDGVGIDVISVPLYLSRGLYPTAAVYALFLLLCIQGLRAWTRDLATVR